MIVIEVHDPEKNRDGISAVIDQDRSVDVYDNDGAYWIAFVNGPRSKCVAITREAAEALVQVLAHKLGHTA